MDDTKVTLSLPNVSIGVMRRSLPEENAEVVVVALKASPSLDVLGHMLTPMTLWAAPLAMWTGLMRAAWEPWLTAHPLLRRRE